MSNCEPTYSFSTGSQYRCPQGCVGMYTGTNPTPDSMVQGSQCTPNSCENITIPNSNHAYYPIHGSYKDLPKMITCNDGYIFNHNLLHKSGNVICDYGFVNNPTETNEMNWYVYDNNLELICQSLTSEDECEGKGGYPIPTYNPYDSYNFITDASKLYELELNSLKEEYIPINCKWDKEWSTTNPVKVGSCHHRKQIDHTTQESICQPLYCPEKEIPNSDKDGMIGDVLPGSIEGSKTGKCINDDGTIYENITNSQDCLCYKHNSCNSCSANSNCQWCGSNGGLDTEESGCYSINTNNGICNNNSIRQSGGGGCTDKDGVVKPAWNQLLYSEQNITECENEFKCIDIESGQDIPENALPDEISMNQIKRNYLNTYSNLPDNIEDLCISYNNTYYSDSSDRTQTSETYKYCYLNKELENKGYSDPVGLPFGLIQGDDTNTLNISIEPYVCVPTIPTQDSPCYDRNYVECEATPAECILYKNPFDNNIINWSGGNGDEQWNDKINIVERNPESGSCCIDNDVLKWIPTQDSGSTSTTCSDDNQSKPTNIYVSDFTSGEKKGLILKQHNTDRVITIDHNTPSQCMLQYINMSDNSINNKYNTTGLEFFGKGDTELNCVGIPDGSMCNIEYGGDVQNVPLGEIWSTLQNPFSIYSNYSNDFTNSNGIHRDTISCNDTQFKLPSQYPIPYPTSPLPTEVDTTTYYATCNDIGYEDDDQSEEIKKIRCRHLNKQINGVEDTVHWGKYCYLTSDSPSDENKVSFKYLCDNDPSNVWVKSSDGSGKCYNTDSEITSCGDLGDYSDVEGMNKCIIEVSEDSINSANVDNIFRDICEKWEITDTPNIQNNVTFEYKELTSSVDNAICQLGISFPTQTRGQMVDLNGSQRHCISTNIDYVKKYNFNDNSYCKLDQITNIEDSDIRWTGGGLDDCGASVFSSCFVTCNDGYGGGGEYTCNYNNDAGEVCQHIQDKFCDDDTGYCILDTSNRKVECESNLCNYASPSLLQEESCTPIVDPSGNSIKGLPEWSGSRCYPLNNSAFSHGITDLPLLNQVFPPLIRLIVFFILLIIVSYILYKVKFIKWVTIIIKAIVTNLSELLYKGLGIFLRDYPTGLFNVGSKILSPGKYMIFIHKYKLFICLGIFIFIFFIYYTKYLVTNNTPIQEEDDIDN